MSVLAEGATINPTEHTEVHLAGLVFNLDTIIATVIASLIVIILGLIVRAKITSGVPNRTQLAFETIAKLARDQVEDSIGVKVAPFLVPVAMSLFIFILACNWLSVLPLHWNGHPILEPPTADVNLVFALSLLLFIWWHAAGARRHGGFGKQVVHTVKGHFAPFAPLWIIEEIVHLVSLPLRLFGNIFAGGIMVSLLALLPAYVFWLPGAGWKLFDMGIGLLQAYLFMLLTIAYFKAAMELEEERH
ncbi:F0F1 ATP synthase subunit A [Labedaea rhizosphaerae]|uniref:ATP synthase subunit a n=1 Tax=Labedaea rhizosphaerae TaxID=598644 RepID=A0A4R6SEW3_LABRH|nr:F0F1 ATP synthase subunit A [Labedaea rhizosphaerae]TDP97715.1 ATP synthase F0 subcomplex A subunit [Labedaea rhizosphaerae]